MSPRRKTSSGWIPALTHLLESERGRVRLPGQPAIYFGPVGIWPANKSKPPKAVEEAYRKVVADWLAKGGEDAPPSPKPGTLTVGDLITAYFTHVKRTYHKRDKPTSVVRLVDRACRPLDTLFSSLLAEQFGPAEFRQVRDEFLREGTCAHVTLLKYAAHIRAMFTWAAEEGLVPESVALTLRGVRWLGRGIQTRKTPGRKKPVPIEDIEAVLPHLVDSIVAMIRLQLLTAMRPEEVCFMRAGDVTEESNALWKYEARDDANKLAHKGIPKVVFIGPKGQAVLAPYLAAARAVGPDAWLFGRGKGDCWLPDAYAGRIKRACERAGVTVWTPGRLRHTRSTETRKKYGHDGAMAELGHVDSSMTGRYSSSFFEELARKIARETG